MKIDRDGFPFIAMAAGPAAVAAARGRWRAAFGFGLVAAGMTAFFRDPDRSPDHGAVDPDVVISPADGKVMHVGPAQAEVAPETGGPWQQISIFLSVADVHINRSPYGGRVAEVTYRPGRYLAAFKAESAHQNERSEVTITQTVDGEDRTVVFRQIVGVMARRVVTRVKAGDTVATGERIGLMKFGSRMDVFVPPSVSLLVSTGQKVVAGETVLARWPTTGERAR
ncbi:MAG: phosphatidylserine decarboxylase [Aquihabitans sp.]